MIGFKNFLINNSIGIISLLISLFFGLHRLRSKLDIIIYKTNYKPLQRLILGNKPEYNFQFCLLSNRVGWFKLQKIEYKFANNRYNYNNPDNDKKIIIYQKQKNKQKIDNLFSETKLSNLIERIFVTPSKPDETFKFNMDNIEVFKKELEAGHYVNSKYKHNNWILGQKIKHTGKLIFDFKTNDIIHKHIKFNI